MANTYSQIFIQAVFAVRGRECLIDDRWKEELFRYITGIVTNLGQKLIAIGGVADHIHLLLSINSNVNLSDLIRDIKANSSRFINEKKFVRGKFYWQEGFGAFSYSRSQLDDVAKYVLNQEQHHRDKSFKGEYISLLKKFDVEFDEKYLFDWID
jgi:REP element-mobilizing transposase RayT